LSKGKRVKKRKDTREKKRPAGGFRAYLPPDADILAVIVALALALRLWFAVTYDQTLYDQVGEGARMLGAVRGGPIGAEMPPLYIGFLRMLLAMFSSGAAKAAFVVKGVAGTCSVVLIYYIASSVANRTVAVVSSAIAALYLNYILAGLALSPRIFGILAVLTVTLLMIKAGDRNKAGIASGVILGAGILIDPYLMLFVPGFLLVSDRRKAFLISLLIVVLPWAARNSVREGVPLPVYRPEAWELDLARWKITGLSDIYLLVDSIYTNAFNLLTRADSWVQAPGSKVSDNISNSTTFAAYSYVLTALTGLVGILRYRAKEHRVLLRPGLVYLGILLLFSSVRSSNRLLAEHLIIFYSSIVLVAVFSSLRKVPDPPSGDG
jgi:hypothetical protein